MSREVLLEPREDTPIFVSTLRMLIENTIGQSVPVADLMKQLNGWVKANKLRRDELEWSSLLDWLQPIEELRPGSRLQKSEVLAFLEAYEIPIIESIYGLDTGIWGAQSVVESELELLNNGIEANLLESGIDDAVVRSAMIQTLIDVAMDTSADTSSPIPDLGDDVWQISLQIAEKTRLLDSLKSGERRSTDKMYDQVPGGDNYQELLLRFPSSATLTQQAMDAAAIMQKKETLKLDHETALDRLAAQEYINTKHWSEPYVIAHVRFNERVIPLSPIAKLPVYNQKAYTVIGGQPDYDTSAETAIKLLEADWDGVPYLGDFPNAEMMEELSRMPGRDLLWVFPYKMLADNFAARHGGQATPVVLPLHSRIIASRQFGEQIAFLVFRGDVPEKRVLFIEEIQSDWAQAGRKIGFHGGQRPNKQESLDANRVPNKDVPPAAPFVTSTEGWVSLALKRMIRYAAERGFDYVAWTSGDQQVSRYDDTKATVLSLRIKEIDQDSYSVRIRYSSDQKETQLTWGSDQFRQKFGPELGQRLMEDAKKASMSRVMKSTSGGLLELGTKWLGSIFLGSENTQGNQGVRIDSEGYAVVDCGDGIWDGNYGLKNFYDDVVPNIARKLVRKLGGAGLEIIDLSDARGEAGIQQGFAVTETMRGRALAGLPRYHRAWHGSPFNFDKFTLDHIGKGEGSQAYGWGLYFAGNKEVAEWYRKQLSPYGTGFAEANVSDEAKKYLEKAIVGSEITLSLVPGACQIFCVPEVMR